MVGDALAATKAFFEEVETKLLTPRPIVRLRATETLAPLLDASLDALQQFVGRIADRLEDGRERDELLEQKTRLSGIQAGASEWLTLGDSGHVYWAERGGRRQTIVTLRGAPIEIAPALRRHLFGRGVGVVCTSATLAIGGELPPFAARIGADDARTGLVRSPFDFERAMRVYVAADVPLPTPQEARLALDVLADYISFCHPAGGGAARSSFSPAMPI